MTERQQSRREILKTAGALTAVASLGPTIGLAAAQGMAGAGRPHAHIDAVLRRATEAKEVPGVVAVAATDKGVFYEGAFGTRDLATGPGMTLDSDAADCIFSDVVVGFEAGVGCKARQRGANDVAQRLGRLAGIGQIENSNNS
jgi:hypothetical protein